MFSSLVGPPSLFDELLTARDHRCLMFNFFKSTSLQSLFKQPLHIGWQSTLYRACTSVTDLQDVIYFFRRDVNVLGWAAQLGPPVDFEQLRDPLQRRPIASRRNRNTKLLIWAAQSNVEFSAKGFICFFFQKTFEKDLFNADQSQAGAAATQSNCSYEAPKGILKVLLKDSFY